jgi:hypothetical protein
MSCSSRVWSPYLSSAALETVRYGGSYSEVVRPGLRLISFNSIFCDKYNLWTILNQTTEHANQFQWLQQTLQDARSRESVWCAVCGVMHVMCGV